MEPKSDMHFIHLNVSSLLPKVDEIRYNAKLTNIIVIRLSKTKHKITVLTTMFK